MSSIDPVNDKACGRAVIEHCTERKKKGGTPLNSTKTLGDPSTPMDRSLVLRI